MFILLSPFFLFAQDSEEETNEVSTVEALLMLVKEGKTKEQAELQAIEKLKAGYAVAIMPEGRLVPPEERPAGVGQGRPGISRIARATGATIVPVAITGSDSVWPLRKGFPIPRMKRPMIKVRFGAPFEFESDDDIKNANQVMQKIKNLLDTMTDVNT